MAQGNDSSISSEWETFFSEVARVVASANNQRGLANANNQRRLANANNQRDLANSNNQRGLANEKFSDVELRSLLECLLFQKAAQLFTRI